MFLAPGAIVDERYELVERIGEGGMGVVFRARDLHAGRFVALKTVIADGLDDEERERFAREAQAAAHLSTHPGFVTVHSWGLVNGSPYYVMELVEGASLKDQFARGGAVDVERLAKLLIGIARALDTCHGAGFVHRDLKPANILVTKDGDAKVADLGLVRALGARSLTQTGTTLGTPGYMAPEQFADASGADARADIYGLGAILYHGLAGRPPFLGSPIAVAAKISRGEPITPPSKLVDSLPVAFDAVCLKALATAPEDRYGTASEFADDLRRALDGEALAGESASAVGSLLRSGAGRATILGGVLVLGALVMTLALFELRSWGPERRARAVFAELRAWDGLECDPDCGGEHALEAWSFGLGDGARPDLERVRSQLTRLSAIEADLEALGRGAEAARYRRRWESHARWIAFLSGESVAPVREARGRSASELCVDACLLDAQGERAASQALIRACLGRYPEFFPAERIRLSRLAVSHPRRFLDEISAGQRGDERERRAVARLVPSALTALLTDALTSREISVEEDLQRVERVRLAYGLDMEGIRAAKTEALNAGAERWSDLLVKARGNNSTALVDRMVALAGTEALPEISPESLAVVNRALSTLTRAHYSSLSRDAPVALSDRLLVDAARLQELLLDLGGEAQMTLSGVLWARGSGPLRDAPLPLLMLALRLDARVARGTSIAEWGRMLRRYTSDPLLAVERPSRRVQFALFASALTREWAFGTVTLEVVEAWIRQGYRALAPEFRADLGSTFVVDTHLTLGRLLARRYQLKKPPAPADLRSALAHCATAFELRPEDDQLRRMAVVVTDVARVLKRPDQALATTLAVVHELRVRNALRVPRGLQTDDHSIGRFATALIDAGAAAAAAGYARASVALLQEGTELAGKADGLRNECELRAYAARIYREQGLLPEAQRALAPLVPRGCYVHITFAAEACRVAAAQRRIDDAQSALAILREVWPENVAVQNRLELMIKQAEK